MSSSSSNQTRSRRWCFTLFFGEGEQLESVEKCQEVLGGPSIDHGVFQVERCPDSGRLHLQGYLAFQTVKSFKQVKMLLGNTAHVEAANGTAKECWVYCTKTDSYVEGPWSVGQLPAGQGKRSDWKSLKEDLERLVSEGQDDANIIMQVFEEYPHLIATREPGVRKILSLVRKKLKKCSRTPPSVRVLWGPTGSGKTRSVVDGAEALGEELYMVPPPTQNGTPWFDGYQGQKWVLFDELPWEGVPIGTWLRWLDRYPIQVQVKGGFVPWTPEVIYLTSNLSPDNWFTVDTREHVDAFNRRVESVENVGGQVAGASAVVSNFNP